MSRPIFQYYLDRPELEWSCLSCSLPPLSDSFFVDTSAEYIDAISDGEQRDDCVGNDDLWSQFDETAKKHITNFKMAHINANSVGGFKFDEIKSWLLAGRFDVLAISETKIDQSFPDSQFHVDSFRFCRSDRKAGGGGLMIYIRSDLCFTRINTYKDRSSEYWSDFKTEFIALKLKLGRNWITVVGMYRPPSVPKTIWKCELSSICYCDLSQRVLFGRPKCGLAGPG